MPFQAAFKIFQCGSISFSADEAFDGTYPVNVVVYNTGACTYIPPGIFMSSCPIDITWFPFDDQNCDMKFGSWTYNGFKVVWSTLSQSNQSSCFSLTSSWQVKREEIPLPSFPTENGHC